MAAIKRAAREVWPRSRVAECWVAPTWIVTATDANISGGSVECAHPDRSTARRMALAACKEAARG